MRDSIVMPKIVASVLCKFMERDYSGTRVSFTCAGSGMARPHTHCPRAGCDKILAAAYRLRFEQKAVTLCGFKEFCLFMRP